MHLLHFTQKVLTSDITLVFYNSAGKRSIGRRLWPFYRGRHRPQKRCGFPSYKVQSWEWNPALLTALIQKIRNPLSHIRKCSPRLVLSLSSLSHFSLTSNDFSGCPLSTWLLVLYRISCLCQLCLQLSHLSKLISSTSHSVLTNSEISLTGCFWKLMTSIF